MLGLSLDSALQKFIWAIMMSSPGEVRAAGLRRVALLNVAGLLLISKLWVIKSWSIRCHSAPFCSPGKQNRTSHRHHVPNKIIIVSINRHT